MAALAVFFAIGLLGAGYNNVKKITVLGPDNWLKLKNPYLEEVVKIINDYSEPEQKIFAGPFIPSIFFEAKKNNVSRHNILITSRHPETFFLETLHDIKTKQPRLIVLNHNNVIKYNYNQDNLVDNYIKENYFLSQTKYGLKFYVLK